MAVGDEVEFVGERTPELARIFDSGTVSSAAVLPSPEIGEAVFNLSELSPGLRLQTKVSAQYADQQAAHHHCLLAEHGLNRAVTDGSEHGSPHQSRGIKGSDLN